MKREGLRLVESNRHDAAIERFRAATQADPADRDAAFLLAATYNRTGDFQTAYAALKSLEDAGYKNREADFEIGWSLLGMGRAGACVPRLERYERASPGRAIVSELLGRCHLLLRNYAKAEASLRDSVARDPSSKARVDLYLTQVQLERGDAQAADTTLAGVLRADSDVGRALRDGQAALAALTPPPADTGLRMSASLSYGYNDNVIGLGNTMPLPTDISGKDSGFLRAGVGVSYTHAFSEKTRGSIGYGGLFERYDEFKTANLDDHFVFADIAHRLNERLALSLRASYQVTYLGGTRFREQPALRPAVAYRWNDSMVTEVSYTYAEPDYVARSIAPQFERDGHINAFSISHLLQRPGSPWSGSISYAHTENRPLGADFQSEGDSVSLAVRYQFAPRTHLTFSASMSEERYANANSLTGFASRRLDRPVGMSAQFTAPLSEKMHYFIQLQSGSSHSNIALFDYKQSAVVAGIGVDF